MRWTCDFCGERFRKMEDFRRYTDAAIAGTLQRYERAFRSLRFCNECAPLVLARVEGGISDFEKSDPTAARILAANAQPILEPTTEPQPPDPRFPDS